MSDNQEPRQGYFRQPTFGASNQSHAPEDDLVAQLRSEWESLSARVCPNLERPDHAILHFFGFAQELDRWIRHWGSIADTHKSQRLRDTLREAQLSLQSLLTEAKALFENERAQRVSQQQATDQKHWLQEQRRSVQAQDQAEQERRRAEAVAKLKQTYQEVNDIYQGIRQNQARSNERSNALWRGAHFPETTCACGKGKLSHQPCCFDCANRGGRTYWY